MGLITLKDALKVKTQDQDKTQAPAQTVQNLKKRLARLDLDILKSTERIDNGRLGIPVYMSLCGADALALTGARKQMGKGGAPDQAEASAVMELVERFSLYAFSNKAENFVVDTQMNLRGKAVTPLSIALSVNDGSSDRERALSLFARTPQRWCPGTNLSTGAPVMVPFDWFFMINEFNGASAGNCTEEALCQGISEVVERHVCALVSQEQIKAPIIDQDSLNDPMALELVEKFRQAGVELILSDLTLGMGAPTVGALAHDPATLGRTSEIVWTAGTAPNPEKAVCRAITEVAQLGGDFNSGANYLASGLPKPKSLDEVDYVRNPGLSTRIQDMPNLSSNNVRIEVENLTASLALYGMDVIALETTHPELEAPAFYTIIPGARFRERAARNRVGLFLARMISENHPPYEAMPLLLQMDAALPGKYYLVFQMGMQHLAMEDPETALDCFLKALSLAPEPEDMASLHVYKAVALKDMGRFQEALAALKEAEALDPDRTDCHNLMGFCHFALKQHEEAIACFEKVLALDPGSAIDYANIASNYRDLGRIEEAIEYYRRALSLDPAIEFARDNLKRLAG